MENVYLVCAALGGTLWVAQFILSLLGGGDHDVGHDAGCGEHAGDIGGHDGQAHGHDSDTTGHHGNAMAWVLGLLTIRGVIAAITFFGLGGLGGTYGGLGNALSLGVSLLSAVAAMIFVGLVMRMVMKLPEDGTVRIENAIGRVGDVYLTVPAATKGPGKVTLKLQERLVEYQAVTKGDELPTGTPIKVVGIVSADTVEVVHS